MLRLMRECKDKEGNVIKNSDGEVKNKPTKMRAKFKYSSKFLWSSLNGMIQTLESEDFKITPKFFEGEKLRLVKRKGVFPYDYFNSFERFCEKKYHLLRCFTP